MTHPEHASAPGWRTEGGAKDQVDAGSVLPIVPPSTDMHEGDAPRCLACHRPLTLPESVARGFGPHCHARLRNLTVAILAAGGSVVVP